MNIRPVLLEQLLSNGNLFLPRIGLLTVNRQPASIVVTEHKILPPQYSVAFDRNATMDEVDVLQLAKNINLPQENFRSAYHQFLDDLEFLPAHGTLSFGFAGNFYRDVTGKLQFKPQPAYGNPLPEVPAKRLVKENSVHQMLVGDKQTDTGQMKAFYTNEVEHTRQWWWVFALVLFVLSVAAIMYYYYNSYNGFFGNGQPLIIFAR